MCSATSFPSDSLNVRKQLCFEGKDTLLAEGSLNLHSSPQEGLRGVERDCPFVLESAARVSLGLSTEEPALVWKSIVRVQLGGWSAYLQVAPEKSVHNVSRKVRVLLAFGS